MLLWLIFTDFYVYIIFILNKCCIYSQENRWHPLRCVHIT